MTKRLIRTLHLIRNRLSRLADRAVARLPGRRRPPPLARMAEWAARLGYGARGFVYLSIGVILLLAAVDQVSDAEGSTGAVLALARQPFGQLWLVILGLGLWAFVLWRILQAVFDADRQGLSPPAVLLRLGQGVSGVFYGLMAASVFEALDEFGGRLDPDDAAENQDKAAALLALPFGDWLLLAAGLAVVGVGAGNVVKGLRADFAADLACSPDLCRRITPIARAGYVARGFAYLPLGVFVVMAGLSASAGPVTSFGGALDALEAQPGGAWVVGLTALGLMAFGAFAFVEACFRRIRAPRDLKPA